MEKKAISIKKLLVNPGNPRFDAVANQEKAIDLMLQKIGKKVLLLAKDIATYGVNPSKSLMVLKKKDGNYLALEGNRRLVALKLLDNPKLAKKNKLYEAFQSLKLKHKPPSSIECVIFGKEEEARRWIKLEHTGENSGVGVVPWNNEQIGRFNAQQPGAIPARAIQLFDHADRNGLSYKEVAPTTLERIVSTPSVREQIGVDFPKARLKLTKAQSSVNKNLRKIFAEMKKSSFTVDKVKSKEDRKKWIAKVLGTDSKGKTEDSDNTTAGSGASEKDVLEGEWITGQLYKAYPYDDRVKAILKELKDVNPKNRPNVCAVSLRVLLELLVYVLLSKRGDIKKIVAQERKKLSSKAKKSGNKQYLPKHWSPDFKQMIQYMIDENIVTEPHDVRALNTYINKKSNEPFLEELNLFIHNTSYSPLPGEVAGTWDKFGKLLFRAFFNQSQGQKK
jgi:hypothetical protein